MKMNRLRNSLESPGPVQSLLTVFPWPLQIFTNLYYDSLPFVIGILQKVILNAVNSNSTNAGLE